MLKIDFIRANFAAVTEGLKKRGIEDGHQGLLQQIIDKDDARKTTQFESDEIKASLNQLAAKIGKAYKSGDTAEAEALKSQVAALKDTSESLSAKLATLVDEIQNLLVQIPNVPNTKVPAGTSEEDNIVFKDYDKALPELATEALPHWELAKKYEIFDLELGTKLTGAGFPVYIGKGARLQRALINFFLDEAQKAGYKEYLPPLMVNKDSAYGTGQLPDKEGQMYEIPKDGLYLIPTAEVPVTNVYRGEILAEADLPIKMTAHTPCFRREAGSYGAHVRGLNRVHQFDKVEIVQIVHPDKSSETLYEMLSHVEVLMNKLELPYRILLLCGGDLGFTSTLTYDFEVYSAAQKRWLEVSSVSNFESFQSNRMQIRFKDSNKKIHHTHTLNGSALALARIMAAILENNQTADGIKIPKVLQPYTGFDVI